MTEKQKTEYVNFGDVARKELGMQCQYASRYTDARFGSVYLGEGLRFKGDVSDYHTLEIHKDDVEEFISRFKTYKAYKEKMWS